MCVSGVQRAIHRLVDLVASFSLRANTRRTYTSRQRTFRALCSSLRINSDAPITERQLCAVCILYTRNHRITSLPGFVSAISHYALSLGHPPLPRGHLFDQVRAGLDNWYGDTNFAESVKAISLDMLWALRLHVDLTSFTDARDWCACLLAFFGLLRIREYTCAGLLAQDVAVEPWGISLSIPFSKTSLIPTLVSIIRRDDALCPVAACRAYLRLVPSRLRASGHPFFLASPSSASPLSDVTFIRRVRRWIGAVFQDDPLLYSGHSFRRGGTTALQLAGVPESTIAKHGRWKSLAYRDYFDVQHDLHLRLTATALLRLRGSSAPPAIYPPLPRLLPPR